MWMSPGEPSEERRENLESPSMKRFDDNYMLIKRINTFANYSTGILPVSNAPSYFII